jgi:hypothetical protein
MTSAEKVFRALNAVHVGQRILGDQERDWLEALKTVGWAVEDERGAALTAEGLSTLQEMQGRRRLDS